MEVRPWTPSKPAKPSKPSRPSKPSNLPLPPGALPGHLVPVFTNTLEEEVGEEATGLFREDVVGGGPLHDKKTNELRIR